MDRPTCATCPFWWPLGSGAETEGVAECRRLPPVYHLHPVTARLMPAWPVSGRYDWCGEHPDAPAYVKSRPRGD
jgi:hypothetical protein